MYIFMPNKTNAKRFVGNSHCGRTDVFLIKRQRRYNGSEKWALYPFIIETKKISIVGIQHNLLDVVIDFNLSQCEPTSWDWTSFIQYINRT